MRTMLLSVAVLIMPVLVHAQAPASCEDLRAVAVEQSKLLHQDYMRTQGTLAEAQVRLGRLEAEQARQTEVLKDREAEIARLKALAPAPESPSAATPPPLPQEPAS